MSTNPSTERRPPQYPITGWHKRIAIARELRVSTKSIGRWHALGLLDRKEVPGCQPGRTSTLYAVISNEVYQRAGGQAARWLKAATEAACEGSNGNLELAPEPVQTDVEQWYDNEGPSLRAQRAAEVRAQLNPHQRIDEEGRVVEATAAPDEGTAALLSILRLVGEAWKG